MCWRSFHGSTGSTVSTPEINKIPDSKSWAGRKAGCCCQMSGRDNSVRATCPPLLYPPNIMRTVVVVLLLLLVEGVRIFVVCLCCSTHSSAVATSSSISSRLALPRAHHWKKASVATTKEKNSRVHDINNTAIGSLKVSRSVRDIPASL